jgi:hypothetical protein
MAIGRDNEIEDASNMTVQQRLLDAAEELFSDHGTQRKNSSQTTALPAQVSVISPPLPTAMLLPSIITSGEKTTYTTRSGAVSSSACGTSVLTASTK